MPFRMGCCIVQYNFAGWDFAKSLKSMHSLGFEGVECYLPSNELGKGETKFSKLLKKYELEPEKFVIGGYAIDSKVGILAEQDQAKIRETRKNFEKNVLIAHENGFPIMVIFSGPCPKDMSEDKALKIASENLSPMSDFAEDHSVEVAIETHKGALAHNADVLLQLRKLASSDNIYANVDPSNYFADGADVVAGVAKLGPLVKGVHVKDAIKVDGKVYWAPAGKGVVDWLAFLKALKGIKYDKGQGWINIEYEAGITGKFDKDPVEGSRSGYDYITSLIETLPRR